MNSDNRDRDEAVERLARAGFPAAREDVDELIQASFGDWTIWQGWLKRRLQGEPIEWLVGFTTFMGQRVVIDQGVYVPRIQTELVAKRAIACLPRGGIALDLCTGSGAVAVALQSARTQARVLGTDIDLKACRSAARNGVEVYQGHLAEAIPHSLIGRFDVVTAVAPYVPTEEIVYLPRDVRKYEPVHALDGGERGIEMLEQVIAASKELLHENGSLVVELGGHQDVLVAAALERAGLKLEERLVDDEGDLRGIHARRSDLVERDGRDPNERRR